MDPQTQKTVIYGVVAVALGYAAYQVYNNMAASGNVPKVSAPSSITKPKAAKKPAYTPSGEPEAWSVEDMKKFLSTRNLGDARLLHDSTHSELLAMVESKIHEPGNTEFSDPQEWSVEDLKHYLEENNLAPGHNPSRVELLAMVESKMHEPKF